MSIISYIDEETGLKAEFETQFFLSEELKEEKARYLSDKVKYDSYYFEYDCLICGASWGQNEHERHGYCCPVAEARSYLYGKRR